ncbi:MAG: hypothetical protein KGQ59_08895, partial [Bdellovibrionales bacterium]|nr:hypothetical protein [Bdellovibrionales bacterium]
GSPRELGAGGVTGDLGGNHWDSGGGGGNAPSAEARYSGGGGGGGGYAGGGGGRGAGEGGPDLASLMEKLMAGQQKEEQLGKPSLEEFGRDPASEVPYSFLDKSVNIFQRVHQAYQSKAKAGRVALF